MTEEKLLELLKDMSLKKNRADDAAGCKLL